MIDLAILGAGPAGVAAAVSALRTSPGLRVTLFERAAFPRDKPCGGALTGLALDEMERLGLALHVPALWPRYAEVRFGRRSERVDVHGRCAVVRRIELDADLASQARAAGAELVENCGVRGLERSGVAWRLSTSRGEIEARAVVAATGVAGVGRRAAGLNAGEKARLREAWNGPAPRADTLVFDFSAAAEGLRGYTWTFPCAGETSNVGVMHLHEAGGRGSIFPPAHEAGGRGSIFPPAHEAGGRGSIFPPAHERGDIPPLESFVPAGHVAYALRCHASSAPAGAPGLLLAGEELGADPLTGEGIGYALWSGRVAGEEAAWALARGRAPDPARLRARLLGSRPGRTLAVLEALARLLYGRRQAAWLARVTEPAAVRALGELVIQRREPFGVLLRAVMR